MGKYQLKIRKKKFLADIITPVGAYLKFRDRYANTLLLESSDYHGEENSFSYICCQPIATFEAKDNIVKQRYPGGNLETSNGDPIQLLKSFKSVFNYTKTTEKFIETGLFGYMSYDAVCYFEDISPNKKGGIQADIPQIRYSLYKYIIAFDHFSNECHLIETYLDSPMDTEFSELIDVLHLQTNPQFKFEKSEVSSSDFTDEEFRGVIRKGIHHCEIGDVFQVVLSRQFQTSFKGDEFQVYRALRSINPSPYLVYFDYGSYKIFGSSPEAQLVLTPTEAIIYPIAGTFKRTGDDLADAELAKNLLNDPKESSEHIMLVDLARNDLSKYTTHVTVETYKEIQYYSHVIHLVSKVSGKLDKNTDPLDIVASTFPAGTLSGAPKYKALELINQYEKSARGYYGGAIGFMDFEGGFNHAIMIRTFMSKENKLFFRAGAGIVAKSDPDNEVQEVYNKLAALENAMVEAQNNTRGL